MSCSAHIRSSMLLASFVFAVPTVAGAELYKWVDVQGVTNYSNQPPPAGARAGSKMRVVEDKVSVYTPDKTLTQAMEAARTRALDDIRTGRREQQIDAEWLARQYLASSQPKYEEPCSSAADPRCAGYGTYSYAPPVNYGRGHRLRIPPQIQLTPGTTAGNVTGNSGFIPGHSAFAGRPTIQDAPRRSLEGPARQDVRGGRAYGGHRGR